MTATPQFRSTVLKVSSGEALGDVGDLLFRDPEHFRAGELNEHVDSWKEIVTGDPTFHQSEVLSRIEAVSVFPFFQHFSGVFKAESYDSDLPPEKASLNNVSCKLFVKFIQQTLLDRLENGAVSLLGKVGAVQPLHLVLPLTVESTKPRLCRDARSLNLWMQDKPFKLDHVGDLPRYVSRNSYQSVLDDKSGYDHILLTDDSRTFFGIQWAISPIILLPEIFLLFDWLRAEVFQLNLKYLHMKITVTMVTQNHQIISSHELRKNGGKTSRF